MTKPEISEDFTMDDIRKLRDYNSERHLMMNKEETRKESKNAIEWFTSEIAKRNGKVVVG